MFPGGVAFTCPRHTPAAPRPHQKSSLIPPTVHGNHQKIQIRLKFIQKNNNIIHPLSSELVVRTPEGPGRSVKKLPPAGGGEQALSCFCRHAALVCHTWGRVTR